jgi:hypothetical protein
MRTGVRRNPPPTPNNPESRPMDTPMLVRVIRLRERPTTGKKIGTLNTSP